MDLSMNNNLFACNGGLTKKNNYGDTTLSLDCSGYEGSKATGCGSAETNPGTWGFTSNAPDDGCRLVLGLGPTPSIYSGDRCPARVNKNNHRSSSDRDYSILKLGLSGATEEVSSALECTVTNTSVHGTRLVIPVVDEGSTSAKKSGGYMPSLLFAPRSDGHRSQMSSEPSAASDYSVGMPSDYQRGGAKKCKFAGCTKGARGATGLCISHGGGQRCQKPGCNKGSESRTAYCKAHGGGRRCQHLGCTKSAEGKTDHCIAHGGGRRCGHPTGCSKAARGKSGLCIRHGGGKRCNIEGCTRSAEGQVGLCISHGGGRRCQFHGCNKGAQGSTMYCKAHGGGKRCVFAGCTKGAEGSTPLCKGHGGGKRCLFDGGSICPKSVHGGTNFCVAHGGGKRCAVAGCTKSARGRTDCCVKHGGGKRCVFESCGKSAQGSTDLCKAHGGGKRCNWGEGKCEKFARGKSGLCAAHSTMVLKTEKKVMIRPGLFHGLVPTVGNNLEYTYSSSGLSVVSDSIDSLEMPAAKRRQLIPPQVLVPLSMKYSPASSQMREGGSGGDGKGFEFVVPEGRVHNGGLLSLLGGNLNNAIDGI